MKLDLFRPFVALVVFALLLSPVVAGCGFLTGGGVLGEVLDSYRKVEVCIGHPKYGWACVMADGTVYFKKPPESPEERKAAIDWAHAEAAKLEAKKTEGQ